MLHQVQDEGKHSFPCVTSASILKTLDNGDRSATGLLDEFLSLNLYLLSEMVFSVSWQGSEFWRNHKMPELTVSG